MDKGGGVLEISFKLGVKECAVTFCSIVHCQCPEPSLPDKGTVFIYQRGTKVVSSVQQ
jgi:hypothetical protein